MHLQLNRSRNHIVAIVEGNPVHDAWSIDTPLGLLPIKIGVMMGAGTLAAHTRFEVVKRDSIRTLLSARPTTGRQHQIRVHAQMSGHPLVGDKLYGPDPNLFVVSKERALSSDEIEHLGHHRHALHAHTLSVPFNGEVRRFSSPLPEDLMALLSPGE